jgi:hypothetical protein
LNGLAGWPASLAALSGLKTVSFGQIQLAQGAAASLPASYFVNSAFPSMTSLTLHDVTVGGTSAALTLPDLAVFAAARQHLVKLRASRMALTGTLPSALLDNTRYHISSRMHELWLSILDLYALLGRDVH